MIPGKIFIYVSIAFVSVFKGFSGSIQNPSDTKNNSFNSETSFINKGSNDSSEIIFYSNEITFSPVITLQGTAEVLWTWADGTTSDTVAPKKNYQTKSLRANRLKVTPWSALRRINIGYNAEDGGSNDIERVPNQQVTLVKNLHLVAPYLKEWCSSLNRMTSLDFSDFINLEIIECYNCLYLDTVILANNSKLKRVCFEDNSLHDLDLSGCIALEDLRGALNNFTHLNFSNSTEELWHICVRDNPQIINKNLFNDMSAFPNIAELFIWNSNQEGALTIHSTSPIHPAAILAAFNNYTSADFSGSLQRTDTYSTINMDYNKLENINIAGCQQVLFLYLKSNNLDSSDVDLVLQQLDLNSRTGGTVDLTYNKPPTLIGLGYKAKLEAKGWTVKVDKSIPLNNTSLQEMEISVYPNPVHDKITLDFRNVSNQGSRIYLINNSGKVVYRSFYQTYYKQKTEINVADFPVGLYIVKVTTPDKTYYYKVVKL